MKIGQMDNSIEWQRCHYVDRIQRRKVGEDAMGRSGLTVVTTTGTGRQCGGDVTQLYHTSTLTTII